MRLLDASDGLAVHLKAAFKALQNDDTSAYVVISDVRNAGIAYSEAVKKSQKLSRELAEDSAARIESEYRSVFAMVLGGVSLTRSLTRHQPAPGHSEPSARLLA